MIFTVVPCLALLGDALAVPDAGGSTLAVILNSVAGSKTALIVTCPFGIENHACSDVELLIVTAAPDARSHRMNVNPVFGVAKRSNLVPCLAEVGLEYAVPLAELFTVVVTL